MLKFPHVIVQRISLFQNVFFFKYLSLVSSGNSHRGVKFSLSATHSQAIAFFRGSTTMMKESQYRLYTNYL
jgi:hypothetical protein